MLRTIIGVMGSGRDPHDELAAPLGRWIASKGYDLLTGGGQGVMAATACAFSSVANRRGISIGIIPGTVCETGRSDPPAGYPNPWVELAVFTHLPLRGGRGAAAPSRNHINVLSSRAIVALPGGAGTRSEVELAIRYECPVMAFLGLEGRILGLDAQIPVARDLDTVTSWLERICGP